MLQGHYTRSMPRKFSITWSLDWVPIIVGLVLCLFAFAFRSEAPLQTWQGLTLFFLKKFYLFSLVCGLLISILGWSLRVILLLINGQRKTAAIAALSWLIGFMMLFLSVYLTGFFDRFRA